MVGVGDLDLRAAGLWMVSRWPCIEKGRGTQGRLLSVGTEKTLIHSDISFAWSQILPLEGNPIAVVDALHGCVVGSLVAAEGRKLQQSSFAGFPFCGV